MGNNPVRYEDPDGREINWHVGKEVSGEDYQRVLDEADKLAESNTVAGERYKELRDSTDFVVNVWITYNQNSRAYAANEEDACDGTGSDASVIINPKDEGKSGDGTKIVLGEIIAHEISGHAYEITKGRYHVNSSNTKFINEAMARCLDEEVAVAMQNEYRCHLGLNQRKIYTGYENRWNMPIYDQKTKSWTIKNHFTRKKETWRLPR